MRRPWIAPILGWVCFGALVVACLAAGGVIRATITLPKDAIAPEQGHAFIVRILDRAWLAIPRNDEQAYLIGASSLFEGSIGLGPGRQLHQAIRDRGDGRFALNRGYLRFSSSDNSDPRENSRRYRLQVPFFPGPLIWLAILLGFAAAAILLRCGRKSQAASRHCMARPSRARCVAVASIGIGAAATVAAFSSIGTIGLVFDGPMVSPGIGIFFGGIFVLLISWPALRRDLVAVPRGIAALRAALWIIFCSAVGLFGYAAVFATGLVTVHHTLDNKTFQAGQGKMFMARLAPLPFGLVYVDYKRTSLVAPTHLSENGVEFGLSVDHFRAISERAAGRFTVSPHYLLFSTPDGSDPRTSGRRYVITMPVVPGAMLLFGTLFAAGLSIIGLRWLRKNAAHVESPSKNVATPGTLTRAEMPSFRATASAAMLGFLSAIIIATVLWRAPWVFGPPTPLAGITLWVAPFVVFAGLLRSVLPKSDFTKRQTISLVLTFVAAFIIAWANLTPMLDRILDADLWSSVRPDGSDILSMIHANDSATYIGTAMHLVLNGSMDVTGSNRPLNGTILAWALWLAGGKLPAILFWRAAFVAFTIVVSAREVAKSFGWLCGLVFGLYISAFTARFLPTALSEPNGVALAALGLALILRALRLGSFGFFLAGTMMTTLALMSRPGAMLFIPALAIFAWSARRHFHVGPTVAIGGTLVAAAFAAILPIYLNSTLAAPRGWILSNFPLVLYGLATGGKGWTQFAIDHPHVSSAAQIYVYALKRIASDPSTIIEALAREFTKFWPVTFDFTKIDLFFSLSILGAIVALLTVRNIYSRFLVMAAASVWLSSPFIIMDGGYRVFAASIPIWAFLAMWPLARLQTVSSGLPAALPTRWCFRRGWVGLVRDIGMSGSTSLAVCIVLVATPLMFRRSAPIIMTRTVTSSCRPGENSVLVRGARTAQITYVVSDATSRSVVPMIRESAFNRHLTVNAPGIADQVGHVPVGSSVVEIVEPIPGDPGREKYHLVFFKGHQVSFPAGQISEICALPLTAHFNESLYVSQAEHWSERP